MVVDPQQDLIAADWFEKYGSWLRSRAVKALGSQEAEDSLQELFVKLLRRGGLDEIDEVEKYLTRAQSNELAEHWRKRARKEVPVSDLSIRQPDDSDVESAVELKESIQLLRQCLPKLRPRQRAVLELRIEGKSREEIAELLSLSPHAVTQLTKRAEQNLARMLLHSGYVRSLFPWAFAAWLRLRGRAWINAINQHAGSLEAVFVSALLVLATGVPNGVANVPGQVDRWPSPGTTTPRNEDSHDFIIVSESLVLHPATGRGGVVDSPAQKSFGEIRQGNSGVSVDEAEFEGPEPPFQDQVVDFLNDPGRALPTCPRTVPCPWSDI